MKEITGGEDTLAAPDRTHRWRQLAASVYGMRHPVRAPPRVVQTHVVRGSAVYMLREGRAAERVGAALLFLRAGRHCLSAPGAHI